jgi:hypothetical protein
MQWVERHPKATRRQALFGAVALTIVVISSYSDGIADQLVPGGAARYEGVGTTPPPDDALKRSSRKDVNAKPAKSGRDIIVNGRRLSPEQIAELEKAHCGPIPDGRYWLDLSSGAWGFVGTGTMGHIRDNCAPLTPFRALGGSAGVPYFPNGWGLPGQSIESGPFDVGRPK